MLKVNKPTSPGMRFRRTVHDKDIWKGKPERSLTNRKPASHGRDDGGRISSRHRSAPSYKRLYREIDFQRLNEEPATVLRIEYDPNRTSYIALIEYPDKTRAYIIAPEGLKKGHIVQSFPGPVTPLPGNCGTLANIPIGTTIHCIEFIHKQGGKLARSAGAYARLLGYNGERAVIKLRSGETRMLPSSCRATVGVVSKKDHINRSLGKAGANRWLGKRPHVRGTAMNPVDHPHGGGEGRTRGRHPVSPTGKPTKGAVTRRNRRGEKLIVENKRRSRRK